MILDKLDASARRPRRDSREPHDKCVGFRQRSTKPVSDLRLRESRNAICSAFSVDDDPVVALSRRTSMTWFEGHLIINALSSARIRNAVPRSRCSSQPE